MSIVLGFLVGANLVIFYFLRKIIMALADVKADLEAALEAVEESNAKSDLLIAGVELLRKEVADLKASGGATASDLDDLDLTAKKILDSAKAQSAEDDAELGKDPV